MINDGSIKKSPICLPVTMTVFLITCNIISKMSSIKIVFFSHQFLQWWICLYKSPCCLKIDTFFDVHRRELWFWKLFRNLFVQHTLPPLCQSNLQKFYDNCDFLVGCPNTKYFVFKEHSSFPGLNPVSIGSPKIYYYTSQF